MLSNILSLPYRFPSNFLFDTEKIHCINTARYELYLPFGVSLNLLKPIYKYKTIEYHPDAFIERYFISFTPWDKFNNNVILIPISKKIIDNSFYSPNLSVIPGIRKILAMHDTLKPKYSLSNINNVNRELIYKLLEYDLDDILSKLKFLDSQNYKYNNGFSNENPEIYFNINSEKVACKLEELWTFLNKHNLNLNDIYIPMDENVNPNLGLNYYIDKISDMTLEGEVESKTILAQPNVPNIIDTTTVDTNLPICDLQYENYEEFNVICNFLKSTPISDLKLKYILSTSDVVIDYLILRYLDIQEKENETKAFIEWFVPVIKRMLQRVPIVETQENLKEIVLTKTFEEEVYLILGEHVHYKDLVISNVVSPSLILI